MEENKWVKGRDGICGDETAKTTSFKCCPSIHNSLVIFCKQNGFLRSQVINWAIKEYIARHQEEK